MYSRGVCMPCIFFVRVTSPFSAHWMCVNFVLRQWSCVWIFCCYKYSCRNVFFFFQNHPPLPPSKAKWSTPNLHHRYKILMCQATGTFCLNPKETNKKKKKKPWYENNVRYILGEICWFLFDRWKFLCLRPISHFLFLQRPGVDLTTTTTNFYFTPEYKK